jgi:ABC-2 type transport system ATP-binding protein
VPELAIHASNITRTYGDRRALDGFSLDVPMSGTFGLLGPNGSGKSTFIAMVAAMESPEEGLLEVLGERPTRQLRRQVATVFQENTADPMMGVSEYLRFAGQLFGLRTELVARVPELLDRFGLAERGKDSVSSLSGGMRRRLEVARALLHRPRLLILDEPTTGIDAEERALLWETLRGAGNGPTILLATNDLAEADAVCDNVAFLQAGRVVASGTPAQLKAGLLRESVRIGWASPSSEHLAQVAAWPGTGEVTREGDLVAVTTDDSSTFVPKLFELAPGAIRSITIATASLEDAYFQHVRRRHESVAK